jgi:hypothetical protein
MTYLEYVLSVAVVMLIHDSTKTYSVGRRAGRGHGHRRGHRAKRNSSTFCGWLRSVRLENRGCLTFEPHQAQLLSACVAMAHDAEVIH